MSKQIADYQLIAELKRGVHATVYRAYEAAHERFVLLKVLHAADESSRARFHNEATHLAQLEHENLVRVLRYGEAPLPSGKTSAYLALEFIDGQTLAEVMHGRKLPPDLALYVVREILQALGHAHERQLVHRDIKPQNILIDAEGKVKVTDFGLAATLTSFAEKGEIVGTPQYMSPEQARGESVTPASDFFSLGAMLYEMLTAIAPFDGESMIERLYRVTHETPAPLTRVLDEKLVRLAALVQRLLEKEPRRRFASAAQALQELRACEEELEQRAFAEDLRRYLNEPEQYQPRVLVRKAAPRTSVSTRRWRYAAFALLCFITLAGAWQLSQRRLKQEPSMKPSPSANEALLTSNHAQASSLSPKEKEPSNAPPKLEFDSTLEHTNDEVEPEIPQQKLFVVEEEKAAAISYLRLSCWPMAYAALNGDTLGQVDLEPSRFELPAGQNVLTLLNPRFPVVQQTLQLVAGDTLDYKISLWEKVAALTLYVQPWAEVSIDGVARGKTPLNEIMLAPGMHTLTFTHPERETFTLERAFVAGQRDTLNIELRRK